MKITAIILASGFGRRFEGNKLLALYKGKPLVRHIMDKVSRQDFYQVILVSQYDEVLSLAEGEMGKCIEAVKNNAPYKGISESIKLGLQKAEACDAYMFFAGDMPLLKAETIKKMMEAFKNLDADKAPILCPCYKGQRGNPVIFSAFYRQELLALEGDVGGRQVIKAHSSKVSTYEVAQEDELMDVDTQLAYEKLLKS